MTEKPTMDDYVKELQKFRKEAEIAGGEERIARHHAKGKMTARERINALFDKGTFNELDKLARHRNQDFGMEKNRPFGDGVITGWGKVNGRLTYAFAHDFTVFGGSLGEVFGEKICKVMDLAHKSGAPMIGLNDSGGARIQEGVVSLGAYAEIFFRNVMSSGYIPQISAIMGPCAGGAVYSPAITDFIIMTDGGSHMYITGPDVIKAVTGEEVSHEQLGGAMSHNSRSGVAHLAAADENEAIEYIRTLLSYIPQNNLETAPRLDTGDPRDRADRTLTDIVPVDGNTPYDMHDVIDRIIDIDSFFEIHPHWAKNIIVGFARLDGRSVGIVANQPMHLAGSLDIDASTKGGRFVRFCDAFNIPLVVFEDVPGFLPGTAQEFGGIIRNGAKLLYAFAEATVPKITVITRKAYGGAYDVMNSKHIRADFNLAWPSAEIAVMGPEGACNIIHRKEIAGADNPEEKREELVSEYRRKFASPYIAWERGYLDDVIEPWRTRLALIEMLEALETKRESRPAKKHGNIPL